MGRFWIVHWTLQDASKTLRPKAMTSMRPRYFGFLAACLALTACLESESRAGTLPLSYTASIASSNLSYTSLGNGTGTVTFTAISGSRNGLANPAPSGVPAVDAVGDIAFTYSGGALPNGYIVTGNLDVLINVTIGSDTRSFTLRETFANLVSSAGIPPAPSLSVLGGGQSFGSNFVDISATGFQTIRAGRGLRILVGFEYALIPEPDSSTLAGIGCVGLVLVKLRRRR